MTKTLLESEPPRAQRRRAKVIVVLPAFNEEQNVGPLLDRIADAMYDEDLPYEIIVVDDGSVDRTYDVLMGYRDRVPLTVYKHEKNQGLGATIRDGLFYASQKAGDQDTVITMDADETHTPGLILRMVRMIREGHDVVIASRYRPGARQFGLSAFRTFLSFAASWLFRLVFPIPGVRDFTCGYRAYRGSTLKLAISTYGSSFVDAEGFSCMVDILLKMRNLHLIFGEVPMILRYDLKQGKSKMNVGRTIRNTLVLMAKRRIGK